MEGLEMTPAPAPVVAAPAPAPAAAAAPAPVVEAPAPSMGGGGGSMDSIKEAFSSLNWNEVIFGILGSAALYYTIYYYRYSFTIGKKANVEIQNRIDDIEIKIADMQGATQRDELLGNPQQGFDGLFSY